ncbi:MAG TPA: glycosyltransferase family 2 protein [Gemmatimonadaceae bacterium]|jgi:hypothetical protein
MTLPPLVDIVVLNYNGWRDTIECLESVFRQEYASFRVILCDNGSIDESRERLEQWASGAYVHEPRTNGPLRPLISPPVAKPIPYAVCDRARAEQGGDRESSARLVIIHTGANLGFTGGNNVGMRYSLVRNEAKYLLLLNNDTVVAPNALTELVAAAERDAGIGAVGGTMLDYRETELVQAAAGGTFAAWHGMVRASQEGARRGSTVADVALDFVSGGCLLAPLAVVRAVGLLDERFFIYGEDQDFSLRIRRAGYKLAYCPAAELWHLGGGTTVAGSPFNDYHNVRSALHFVAKHYPYLLPTAAAYSIYRCVLPKIARRQWPRLRATGRGYRDFLRDFASRRFTTAA